MRRSIRPAYGAGRRTPGGCPAGSAEVGADLVLRQATEGASLGARAVEDPGLELFGGDLPGLGHRGEELDGGPNRGREIPPGLIPVTQGVGELFGVPAH